MNKVIDWFWDGMMLRSVNDKSVVKHYILLYLLLFLQVFSVVCFSMPILLTYIAKGIFDFNILFIFGSIFFLLLITFIALINIILRYKNFK